MSVTADQGRRLLLRLRLLPRQSTQEPGVSGAVLGGAERQVTMMGSRSTTGRPTKVDMRRRVAGKTQELKPLLLQSSIGASSLERAVSPEFRIRVRAHSRPDVLNLISTESRDPTRGVSQPGLRKWFLGEEGRFGLCCAALGGGGEGSFQN